MDAQMFVRIVSSATAGLVFILGIILLTGWFLPPAMPENLRLIMGIVLVLYGGYRLVMIWMTRKTDEEPAE
jgi:hypothetical protein